MSDKDPGITTPQEIEWGEKEMPTNGGAFYERPPEGGNRTEEVCSESGKAESLYRSLLHTSADAIVLYDLKGLVKYVNPIFIKIFGWPLEEIQGKRFPFIPQSELEATRAGMRLIVEQGQAIQGVETKRLTKEGALVDVSVSGSRYEDNDGNPAGMLEVIRDISEKRRLQIQLQYAQRMEAIGTLAGGIAHNFNNLLMGIQGNTSLMLLETDQEHPSYKRLQSVEKLVQQGAKLTSQLLGFAREGKYEVRPISLNKVVRETVETFSATKKEIRVRFELAENLRGIIADRDQLDQVIMNLFVNAADAMPEGGDLTFTTMNVTHRDMTSKPYHPRPGNYALLKVSDNGVGMDEATRARIFEPFFTTKGLVKGTGLGLSSVYGIVKGHGGYIDVESEPSRGTAFEIYLPASGDEAQVEREPAKKRVSEVTETVLLVDDEEVILDVGGQFLRRLGYQVLTANSGKQALKIYEGIPDKIDMVILDMIMPDMGGGETFDRLKALNPDIKVLLSSGYSINGQATDIMARGCRGFIQKPFNMGTLSQKLREILDGQ